MTENIQGFVTMTHMPIEVGTSGIFDSSIDKIIDNVYSKWDKIKIYVIIIILIIVITYLETNYSKKTKSQSMKQTPIATNTPIIFIMHPLKPLTFSDDEKCSNGFVDGVLDGYVVGYTDGFSDGYSACVRGGPNIKLLRRQRSDVSTKLPNCIKISHKQEVSVPTKLPKLTERNADCCGDTCVQQCAQPQNDLNKKTACTVNKSILSTADNIQNLKKIYDDIKTRCTALEKRIDELEKN